MTDPDQAIRTLFEHHYPKAVASRDLDGYVDLYTSDALWIPPGKLPRRGKEAIGEGFREMLDGHTIHPAFSADEIELHGDTATVLGRADALVADIGTPEEQRQTFHALWIVREHVGRWLIHRQIWTPTR
jgi:uncharacterized protein (TIGR02246 family)